MVGALGFGIRIAAVVAVAGVLTGCGPVAMTTDEFRAQALASGNIENIEVNRSLREVAATFRERASVCLKDIVTTTTGGPRRPSMQFRYHETVVVTDRRVDLTVQALLNNPFKTYDEPADGTYVLTARAVPIDGTHTRVEIVGSTGPYLLSSDALPAAVRGWAAGTSTACPVLS